MNKIRVLLANHPMMIPDAIRQLVAEQEDMELVGDCRGPMHILRETGRIKADAVILAHEHTKEPGLCSQLLSVYPDLTICKRGARLDISLHAAALFNPARICHSATARHSPVTSRSSARFI